MANWSDNAKKILEARYLARNSRGEIVETPDQMLERVAHTVARAEKSERQSEWYNKFLGIMDSLEFLPNSPTLMNAGRELGMLSACFYLPLEDSIEGIFETVKQSALIFQAGGGVGVNASCLRPEGATVHSTNGLASGPVSFLKCFDTMAATVSQGGRRRGALLGVLNATHPDIFKFIDAKKDVTDFQNFNFSVGINGGFMQKVRNDETLHLSFRGTPFKRDVKARDIFDRVCINAWESGEPGFLFFDNINRANPTPFLGYIVGANPCLLGETRMLTKQGVLKISDIKQANFLTPNGWSFGTAWKTGRKKVVKVSLSNGQTITTTPDHRFFVVGEKLPAEKLLGLRVAPFVGDGSWDGRDDFDIYILQRLGFLLGDGGFRHDCTAMTVNIGKKDSDLRGMFSRYKWHGERTVYIPSDDGFVKTADALGMLRVSTFDRVVPDKLWEQSPKSVCAFLRGLYSANGSVLRKAHRITLKGTSLHLLQDVQQLLLALGFRPYITTNKSHAVAWHNGVYKSRQSYDLNISGSEARRFADKIGFIQQYKTDALADVVSAVKSVGRRIRPVVVSVEDAGEADVYDFNVPDSSHVGWANGFSVSNCSEATLLPWESCNLGSINLTKFLKSNNTFDFDTLKIVVTIATRFLDDVIDVNNFPRIQIERRTKLTRKIGLGVMGWADVLGRMGIDYDTYEALEMARRIMSVIRDEAYKTSRFLGKEKGHCFKALGRRNASLTSIAPTGTLSILADCSSSIEPLFSRNYTRNIVGGLVLDFGTDYKMKTALEISPVWHVRMQAAFQENVCQGVSKTINMPEDATVDDVKNSMMLAHQLGCKGITVYRQGTRDAPYKESGGEEQLSECQSGKCLI